MQSTQSSRMRSIVTALVVIGVVFYAGVAYGQRHRPVVAELTALTNKDTPPDVQGKTDFLPFWEAWGALNEKFVAATSTAGATDQEKVWGAISGLTASLNDPYTVFFPPEEAKLFESEISGNFEGVGMEIGIKDDVLTVIAPLKGTPAERAGMRPGDKILKINDQVSTSMRVEQAVKLIRGPRGTEVRLNVFREGKKEPFEVKVMRDIIDIPTIDTETRSVPSSGGTSASTTASGGGSGLQQNGVFVIKLYSFSLTSPRLFREALRTFRESGSNKLVLDLRGNPGGFLDAAVDMASYFLPAGKTIVTEDSGGKAPQKVHRSFGYDVFTKNLKMAVLINSGSASASEILAGALQDHGIAKLVGTRSFGKGSVQELIKLTPDTSLKVTVARWLTPKGNSISAGGLTPDVEVKLTLDDIEKKKDPQMDRAIELLTE